MSSFRSLFGLAGVAASLFLAAPRAQALDARDDFHRAYYLQHAEGDLETALELFSKVAESRSADAQLRARAGSAARSIAEDLATSDFARLMPPDTIFYAELREPGARLGELVQALGLLQTRPGGGGEGPRYGISPLLLRASLGLRGAAIGITDIDPNGGPPRGVLVLHPGELDGLRGLIETVVPAGGQEVEPIAGHRTWSMEGEALVTMSERLVVASTERGAIEDVLTRLDGRASSSLATNGQLEEALAMRGEDLLYFCLNAEPLRPLLRAALEQEARSDPGAATALAMLDVDSLRSVAGHLALGGDGLELALALDLEEGHQNLAFNLLRMPSVNEGTLQLVPRGAAFFLATALNEPRPVPASEQHQGAEVVSLMDFGRELFGNVADVAFFGLPSTSASGGRGMPPLPDLACVVRVNDPARSRALWNFVFGLASQSTPGGDLHPEHVRIAGRDAERWTLQGVPVYLVQDGHQIVISPSETAIASALGVRSGGSVVDDPVFASTVAGFARESTFALALCPGRVARMAEAYMPPGEAQNVMPVAQLLEGTAVSLGMEHSETRLALALDVRGLPDVGGLVAHLIDRQKAGGGAHRVDLAPARPAAAPSSRGAHASAASDAVAPENLGAKELVRRFRELAGAGRHDAAAALGQRYCEVEADAGALNDFAWALLTEGPLAGEFDALALQVARKSNELSDYGNWYCLDTLALALHRGGEQREALAMQRKAVAIAERLSDPRVEAARESLERYRKAAEGHGSAGGS